MGKLGGLGGGAHGQDTIGKIRVFNFADVLPLNHHVLGTKLLLLQSQVGTRNQMWLYVSLKSAQCSQRCPSCTYRSRSGMTSSARSEATSTLSSLSRSCLTVIVLRPCDTCFPESASHANTRPATSKRSWSSLADHPYIASCIRDPSHSETCRPNWKKTRTYEQHCPSFG